LTNIQASDAPVFVPIGGSNEHFVVRRSKQLGLVALGILVTVFAVVALRTSDIAVNNMETVSETGNTTSNIVIVQRESLVFVFAFEQWLSGTIPRRDLEVRRALLAERLLVRDDTGVSNGERVQPEYFQALGVLDDYMEAGPSGLLPPDDQIIIQSKSADALNGFIFESRQLVARIAEVSDEQMRQLVRDENIRRTKLYVVVLVVLVLVSLVAGFLTFRRLRDFRRIGVRIDNKHRELDEMRARLQEVNKDLQMRLERERTESAERKWIDSGVRSISAQFRGTPTSEAIAEFMVEGLGRFLRADSVISHSFAELPWPRIVKQWHQRPESQVDESFFAEFESRWFTFINRLWGDRRVDVVVDSNHIEISPDQIPEIVEITRQRARSWVIVPVGEGTHVMGFVLVAMVENARVWSAAEIELIQEVSAAAAGSCTQSRLFWQSMQIAENDAEVGRLIELDKAKNDFIENMNHESRTPLTSIIGYTEVALDGVDADAEPALASSLTAVQRNARRLQILIENMMQVSKTDLKHVPLLIATVDVGQLLGNVANSLHLGAEDCGVEVTLRLDSPAGDLLIDGDSSQLEQVFVNLMSNAIKFTPRGGTVTVVARQSHSGGDVVEVKVKDTGIGIPVKEFPNVFKRFFRASTATQASIPGFGIGLSLVHSVVREHHGRITFDSTVGKGTVFTVTLPARFTSTSQVDQTT